MGIKTGLAALYRHEQEEERRYVARMNSEERSATGTPEKWSSKDVFAHIAYWNGKMAVTLEKAGRDETPEPYGELDEVNAETFELTMDLQWSQIRESLKEATESLVSGIEQLPEEDLIKPERFPWQRGQPLWRSVVYVTYYHTMRHLAELYLARGDGDYGQQLQENAAMLQEQLDNSPGWQASVYYNLACYYAVTGNRSKAIDRLEKAFRLSPDLIAWSINDSDIDSIRDDPGYLNLIPSSLSQG
jgi:tetratricopeptide (TPR) repeat protein